MKEDRQAARRKILRELGRIAFLDPRDYLETRAEEDGLRTRIREIGGIPLRARRAIESISENRDGSMSYKFYSKLKALELLEKMEAGSAAPEEDEPLLEGDRLLLEKVVRRLESGQHRGEEP